jgi:hypothetical protein
MKKPGSGGVRDRVSNKLQVDYGGRSDLKKSTILRVFQNLS